MTATGEFIERIDNDVLPPTPFNACMACPRLHDIVEMKWGNDGYQVTRSYIYPTLYAALVQYMDSYDSDKYVAPSANFANLAYFKKLVSEETAARLECSADSDSTDKYESADGDKVKQVKKNGSVQLSCETGFGGAIDYTVSGIRSGDAWLISDAFVAASNF